jgi:hypothetical protein
MRKQAAINNLISLIISLVVGVLAYYEGKG